MLLPLPVRRRWLALFGPAVVGLLLGLVGMHHLSATTDPPGQPPVASLVAERPANGPLTGHPPGEHAGHGAGTSPEGHSDLLHLCLAVLGAIVIAVGALGPRWGRPAVSIVGTRGPQRPRTSSRGPPPPVPRRLAQLCVLRT
jgi:hypothetical protein